MKECNRICEWNNPSNGCVKPETVDCKMPNLFKGAKPQTNDEELAAHCSYIQDETDFCESRAVCRGCITD